MLVVAVESVVVSDGIVIIAFLDCGTTVTTKDVVNDGITARTSNCKKKIMAKELIVKLKPRT